MQSTIFTADYFFECCRIVEQMVESKTTHGDSEDNVMNFLLSSALSSRKVEGRKLYRLPIGDFSE